MHDKDGKPVGILAHELKTDTSKMSDGDMIISLDKNLENLKINDQASNQDIIYYNNPRPSTNKETLLMNSAAIAKDINKISDSEDSSYDEGKFDISSFPETSDTGLME